MSDIPLNYKNSLCQFHHSSKHPPLSLEIRYHIWVCGCLSFVLNGRIRFDSSLPVTPMNLNFLYFEVFSSGYAGDEIAGMDGRPESGSEEEPAPSARHYQGQ